MNKRTASGMLRTYDKIGDGCHDTGVTVYDVSHGLHSDEGYILVEGGFMTVYKPHYTGYWLVASGHVFPLSEKR